MVKGGVIQQRSGADNGSCPGLSSGKDEGLNPRVHQGATAHGAGLKRDIQGGAGKSIVSFSHPRLALGQICDWNAAEIDLFAHELLPSIRSDKAGGCG